MALSLRVVQSEDYKEAIRSGFTPPRDHTSSGHTVFHKGKELLCLDHEGKRVNEQDVLAAIRMKPTTPSC